MPAVAAACRWGVACVTSDTPPDSSCSDAGCDAKLHLLCTNSHSTGYCPQHTLNGFEITNMAKRRQALHETELQGYIQKAKRNPGARGFSIIDSRPSNLCLGAAHPAGENGCARLQDDSEQCVLCGKCQQLICYGCAGFATADAMREPSSDLWTGCPQCHQGVLLEAVQVVVRERLLSASLIRCRCICLKTLVQSGREAERRDLQYVGISIGADDVTLEVLVLPELPHEVASSMMARLDRHHGVLSDPVCVWVRGLLQARLGLLDLHAKQAKASAEMLDSALAAASGKGEAEFTKERRRQESVRESATRLEARKALTKAQLDHASPGDCCVLVWGRDDKLVAVSYCHISKVPQSDGLSITKLNHQDATGANLRQVHQH